VGKEAAGGGEGGYRGVGKEAAGRWARVRAEEDWGLLCDGRGLGQMGKKLGRLRYLAKCKLCVAHYAQYAPRILDT
jgi:hypothetical protein